MKELFHNINTRVVLVVLLAFLLGWQMGHRDLQIKVANFKPTFSIINKEPPQNIPVNFKLFWDTWNLVSRTYFDKNNINANKLFYGAISGMVAALDDPYTVFLSPEQQKYSKEELNGSFEGVGIQLGFNNNKEKRLVVIAPLSGSPAEKAGIKAGDFIVKINDYDTASIVLPEAVSKIRGIKGTEVNLSIFREGELDTRVFTLKRDTIVVKSVELSFEQTSKGKKVGVIKLSKFGEKTNAEWNEVVDNLILANSQAVVLDLRNDPGGFLDGAVYIASEFLDGGNVVLQENSEGEKVAFKVNRKGKLLQIPLVVLINKGSASAAEIVAGAIQDRQRGKLVGDKSFGKGTIQEAQDLEGGAGIHITVAKWLTPNSRWVNEIQGLEPDIKIVVDNKETSKDDLQLKKAIEVLE